jgi:hypothetical protein
VSTVSKHTLFANLGNLSGSATSWYEYLIFSISPRKLSSTRTPSGMRGRMRAAIGFLRGDRGTCFFPFFGGGGWLEVPTTHGCYSEYHSIQPVTSSTIPFGGWFDIVV